MAAEVSKFGNARLLSCAGCLSDEVFLELDPSARPGRVVVHDVLDRLSAAPQPADDLPQLGSLEQSRCLLYRQPPARQRVGKDLALWVSYHILVVLVCTRIGGQATPGKSFRLRGSLRLIARSLVFVGCPPGRRQVGLRVYRRFRHSPCQRTRSLSALRLGLLPAINPSPRWVAIVGVPGSHRRQL